MKNRVHPELLAGLEVFSEPDLRLENLPAIREQAAAILPDIVGDESLSITEEIIEGPDANPLRLKIYRPKSNDQTLPALL